MSRGVGILKLTTAILTCVWVLGGVGCRNDPPPPHAPPMPHVNVATVVPQTIPDEPEFIGQTASFRPVEIRSQVTGIIKKVFFTEGRDVKEGDRLYLIDPLPFEAAVLSARAQVSQAEVRLIQTRQDYERVKPLLEEQAVSQKDVDDTVTEGLAANASLDAANADLVKAQFNLNNTLIVAPISGVTERSRLYEGRLVSANTDLLTKIRQLDPIYVNVSVPETYILRRRKELAEKRVQRGDLFQLRGTLTFTDGSTYPHQGVLDFADVAFRPETGMLQGRFVFPNPRELFGPEDEETSPRLLPGQFVKLRLLGYTRHNALLVPQRAVQQGPTGSVLFIVGEGDMVEMRDVSATIWHGNQWLIEDGVYPGERVVTDGLHMIRPGIQVKPIMQTDEVPATAPEPEMQEPTEPDTTELPEPVASE